MKLHEKILKAVDDRDMDLVKELVESAKNKKLVITLKDLEIDPEELIYLLSNFEIEFLENET